MSEQRLSQWPGADQIHRFGVAREAGLLGDTVAIAARAPREAPRPSRGHPMDHRPWRCGSRAREGSVEGRLWAHFRSWRASRDNVGDRWHRLQCRLDRHEMHGGEQVQLGSRLVHVELRCRWCSAKP